ncbi:uncharacterized protein LOC132360056 [Balaenoptera ricei]|uniref:uncharacterized protein LOC132360056 n=1 Tax=Balaenoptera ricei TaxID=2746895 RepID=UPI0028BDA1B0|nr:uncharacterized protein LOC132360056 [Balaenoptera ricei]
MFSGGKSEPGSVLAPRVNSRGVGTALTPHPQCEDRLSRLQGNPRGSPLPSRRSGSLPQHLPSCRPLSPPALSPHLPAASPPAPPIPFLATAQQSTHTKPGFLPTHILLSRGLGLEHSRPLPVPLVTGHITTPGSRFEGPRDSAERSNTLPHVVVVLPELRTRCWLGDRGRDGASKRQQSGRPVVKQPETSTSCARSGQPVGDKESLGHRTQEAPPSIMKIKTKKFGCRRNLEIHAYYLAFYSPQSKSKC